MLLLHTYSSNLLGEISAIGHLTQVGPAVHTAGIARTINLPYCVCSNLKKQLLLRGGQPGRLVRRENVAVGSIFSILKNMYIVLLWYHFTFTIFFDMYLIARLRTVCGIGRLSSWCKCYICIPCWSLNFGDL